MNHILTNLLNIADKLDKEIKLPTPLPNEDLTKWLKAISELGTDENDAFVNLLESDSAIDDTQKQILFRLDLLNEIFHLLLTEKENFTKNDLSSIFLNKDDMLAEFKERERIEKKYILLFNLIFALIKANINEIYSYSKVSVKVDRVKKGKLPKAKKPAQLKAEEYAKEIWAKAPDITQENMAYQLKDKLDLTQSIRTIINWIKPFKPKP
ncbi:hypothetical protein MHD_00905 [Mannheimia granulomatis]|uniref:Uncharacterized protein n=1 Tax=Mannheimia granulomatis TaxID=85402 RepID=A0A011NCK9_9PAST|nr:hypothetical protein [Mannheimia granulomatis]EXI62135.1 hypothetical protein AK33_07625 [Mannheimia granulomatis]RGE49178.1 hypothetical protein MHD_00905 [Mannheimia granulomatis]